MNLPEFLFHLQGARQNGQGHTALCPAHDDRTPSLSVSEGDGRLLIHCHAGCSAEQVVAAMGLTMRDLFSEEEDSTNGSAKRTAPAPAPPIAEEVVEQLHRSLTEKARSYLCRERMLSPEIIDRYQLGIKEQDGERRVTIPVRDAGGVIRDIRRWLAPEARKDGTLKMLPWEEGRGATRLSPEDQLAADELVFDEGELDSLALISHDIPAITLTNGANTVPDRDTAPLFAGKIVTILMDHDEAGQKGALKRAEALAPYTCEVKIASWPEDRPKGWDVTDELKAHGLESLKKVLAAAVPFEVEEIPARSIERVEPFPLKALASPFRALVEEGAAAIQCPSDFIAVPLLTVAGAAAGATCCLVLKEGWEELPALFNAVVAAPGTAKTAAQQSAIRPVFDRAAKLRQQWEAEMTLYEAERTQWEKDKVDHKPQPPKMRRAVVSDVTVEAVAQVLDENPRGVLLCRDELSGWAQSLDAYRGGKGGDRQFYLSVWSGAPCSVDRKKQDRPIILERPFLAITGALPPDTVRSLLHEDRRDDGFIDRILFAYPEASPPRHWSEATVRPATLEEVSAVFTRLYELALAPEGPVQVRMSAEAKALWVEWYEGHQAELVEVEENLRGAYAKMPIQAARLILISHLTRWAAGKTAALEVADRVSVACGTALAEYHKSHARRVWGVLGEREGDRTARRLVEWLRRRGNPGVRPRDVVRAEVPGIRTAGEAKKTLDGLAESGKGEWRQPPAGLAGQRGPELFFLFLPDTRHPGLSLDPA